MGNIYTVYLSTVLLIEINLCSCQRPAVGARPGEAGGFWGGRSTDGHADQEGDLRGNTVLDGPRGHPAVRLRLQGQTQFYKKVVPICYFFWGGFFILLEEN